MRTKGEVTKKVLCPTNKSVETSTNPFRSTVIGELGEFSPWGSSLEEQENAKICKEYHPAETSLLVFSWTLPGSPPAKAQFGNPPGLRGPQMCNNSQGTQQIRSSAWGSLSFNQPVFDWAVVPHIWERKILASYIKTKDLLMPCESSSL